MVRRRGKRDPYLGTAEEIERRIMQWTVPRWLRKNWPWRKGKEK